MSCDWLAGDSADLSLVSAQFVAFVALSLVVEVNSVFLHARQLLIITGCARRSACYRANALLNAASFLVFRLVLLGGLTAWILGQRHNIGLGFLGVAGLGLGVIVSRQSSSIWKFSTNIFTIFLNKYF